MIDSEASRRDLRSRLLAWYDAHRRELPWRFGGEDPVDPYRVWLSEVMLQQTRVETVRGYYERWLERFPTLEALADASPDEVMKAWEGLGYYSRARNFHRAVREVVERYGGNVPADPAALRSLPGVGRYTAGAVLSIAFGRQMPVVDGNVRRVMARWYDEPEPRETDLWSRAEAVVEGERPGDLNQALMELGALVCTPRSPKCAACPVAEHCRARANGTVAHRPARRAARTLPHEDTAVAIVRYGGNLLLARRRSDVRLGGMWEFPGGIRQADEAVGDSAVRHLAQSLGIVAEAGQPLGEVVHVFSHVRVTYRAVVCRFAGELPREPEQGEPVSVYDDAQWVEPSSLERYALPSAQRKLARLAVLYTGATVSK